MISIIDPQKVSFMKSGYQMLLHSSSDSKQNFSTWNQSDHIFVYLFVIKCEYTYYESLKWFLCEL